LNTTEQSFADFYVLDKPVSANFVISCSGLFRDQLGSSRGISNETDRQHLMKLRAQADGLITGGNTARVENYSASTARNTYVFTQKSLQDGLKRLTFTSRESIIDIFGLLAKRHSKTLIEAGPSLLRQFLDSHVVDTLFLTVTHRAEDCVCSALEIHENLPSKAASDLLGIPADYRRTALVLSGTCLTRLDFGEPSLSS
jgi:dihydrofolate reductase